MPAKPRWLLAIPDAIRQLEALDRDLLDAARRREAVRGLAGAKEARPAERVPAPASRSAAQALTSSDYERFETIVGKGERPSCGLG